MILQLRAKQVIGVDTSNSCVEEARRRYPAKDYPSLEFHTLDALIARQQMKELGKDCNVVYVDIGGDRDLTDVVGLLPWVESCFRPRLIVVKSRALYQHAKKFNAGIGDVIHNPSEWWEELTSNMEVSNAAKAKHFFGRYRFAPLERNDGN